METVVLPPSGKALYSQTGLDMEKPEESQLDFALVPHLLGVPRYLFRSALTAFKASLRARLANDAVSSFERELWLWAFAGIVRQRWKDRGTLPGSHATLQT